MFVQIDELPSMYSRPFESRTVAPCPSTSTSGSCSGAHHSRMLVNGCQTNFLSVAISSSVFQSLISYHVIRFSAVFGTALPNQSLTLVLSLCERERRIKIRRAMEGISLIRLSILYVHQSSSCNDAQM